MQCYSLGAGNLPGFQSEVSCNESKKSPSKSRRAHKVCELHRAVVFLRVAREPSQRNPLTQVQLPFANLAKGPREQQTRREPSNSRHMSHETKRPITLLPSLQWLFSCALVIKALAKLLRSGK